MSVGFNNNKKKKPATVRKVWDADSKTHDYEIIGDENLKYDFTLFTKKMLEQENRDKWFNEENLTPIEDVQKYKKKIKEDYYNYDNMNDLKKHIFVKRYATLESIEHYFFYFIKRYPKKKVFRFNNILAELYVEKPSLDRLKYRTKINLPKEISHISNDTFGFVSYWVLKDAIIFKN